MSEHQSNQSLKMAAPERLLGGDSVCRTYSIEQAARILGISRPHAYTMARSGDLPTVKLGSRLLVPKAVIEKILSVSA